MSEGDDADFWHYNQLGWVQHITPESVESALRDFEITTEVNNRWLSGQIRKAFFSSVGTEEEIDEYPGKLAVRREIQAIADAIASAKTLFAARSGWAESVFRRYSRYDDLESLPDFAAPIEKDPDALDRLDADKEGWWVESSNQIAMGSADWRRFREMACGMIELEQYMRDASEALCGENDPSRWREAEKRKRRLAFANELAVVFEEAYKRDATVNSWPDDTGQPKLGPWPNFFERIACLALQIDKVPDLEGLLKKARRERLDKISAEADGIHSQLELDWAEERLVSMSARLKRASVIMIRRFASEYSP